MNESSNSNQGVSGRAVATSLGVGASVALTGAGLLMGRKSMKGVGKSIKNNTKAAQSAMLRKKYKGMIPPMGR